MTVARACDLCVMVVAAPYPDVVVEALLGLEDDVIAPIAVGPNDDRYDEIKADQVKVARRFRRTYASFLGEAFEEYFVAKVGSAVRSRDNQLTIVGEGGRRAS